MILDEYAEYEKRVTSATPITLTQWTSSKMTTAMFIKIMLTKQKCLNHLALKPGLAI